MLTRLKVSGFKNLVDVDIRFGTFTCIAGANGVGKSNLFDAIQFLSYLADRPLIQAAQLVRDKAGKSGDIRSLFHRVGDTYDEEMSFVAEMIVSQEAEDELGQTAKAAITFLRYSLTIAYRSDERLRSIGSLEILEEKLEHINRGEANIHLRFPHKVKTWRDSVLTGRRNNKAPFISTEEKEGNRVIKLHQDGGSSGQPLSRLAAKLPRTVLSATNAAESPTALIAKQEMRSWRLLQLEPSSLRQPDAFAAPTTLETDGSHLASTLYYLARHNNNLNDNFFPEKQAYAQIANRLAELIEDVGEIWVERDDQRELLTLMVKNREGTIHPARSLSDGTMRFVALAVLELDLTDQGVICLEEPENGIHPERIPKILQLLQDIATDTEEEIAADNPLRQIIINTHSPVVVQQVPDDSLVVAELKDTVRQGKHFKRVSFSCLRGTWRDPSTWKQERADSGEVNIVAKGDLLAYLNPVPQQKLVIGSTKQQQRVIDRKDLQPFIPGILEELT